MATTTYGTGTALQFSDGTQRQVLELGSKIHYYNPSVTPLLTLLGRMSTSVTPVPIFEWMEDEYMMQKSIVIDFVGGSAGADSGSTVLSDTATSGVNGENVVVLLDTEAQLEMFEVGGIYAATLTGTGALATDVTHLICCAIGQDVNITSPSDRQVQFLPAHKHASLNAYNTEAIAGGTDVIGFNVDTTLTLTYVATAGLFYDNAVATSYYGYNVHSGTKGFGEITFDDADYFMVEGGIGEYAEGAAVGSETRKKVRRLKNCTQIFREPYSITGTAQASKHYGGSELARLQARKLAKIKSDIEFAMLTNGDISLDATSENPKRTMAGFGIGASAGTGFVKSLDGRSSAGGNANLRLDFDAADLDLMDAAVEYIFSDTLEGSMEKTVLCSNKWLRFITALGRQGVGPTGTPVANISGLSMNQQAGASGATAGLQVTQYQGPVGKLNFIPHPMLKGAYENYALAVDMANVDLRPLASRDMQLRSDIVNDGRDGRTDEWLMEVGCEIRNEQTHAIMLLT